MNKIERVRAALRGEPVDRIPASFWKHFPAEASTGRAMARAHIDFYRATDPDFLKVMNDNPYELAGVERIDHAADWARLRPARRRSQARMDYFDGLKEILDAVAAEAPVIVTLFNPFATANDNRTGQLDWSDADFQAITTHLREDPAATLAGLGAITESLAEMAMDCIELGAAGLFLSANGGESNRFTPKEFAAFIAPHDQMLLQAAADAGAEFNLLHVCGSRLRLESYAGYPAHAVNWAAHLDNPALRDGRTIFAQTLVGGIDQDGVIASGPMDAIEAEVRAAIAEAGELNFMIGAGCALHADAPAENLLVARSAAG